MLSSLTQVHHLKRPKIATKIEKRILQKLEMVFPTWKMEIQNVTPGNKTNIKSRIVQEKTSSKHPIT